MIFVVELMGVGCDECGDEIVDYAGDYRTLEMIIANAGWTSMGSGIHHCSSCKDKYPMRAED